MTTHGISPRTVAVACLVAAVTLFMVAWCSLPGPQPAAVTPTAIPVVVQPTTFVFVTMTPVPSPVPERILSTPTRAPTSTPIATQTPVPTVVPTVTVDPTRMRQRG